jgi:dTDP-4-amino-4,6-dideoxy-D-galactose acyltransferase
MQKLFVIDKGRVDDYGKELLYALEKAKVSDIKADFIYADQLELNMLQERNVDVLISNGLSPEWHYILKGLGCVSIVFDVLHSFVTLADIVIDHKANNQISNFGTSDFSLFDNPNFNFNEIANLVKKLAWDTDFFGVGVGYVSSRNLTENIYKKIHKFSHSNDVKILEYLCNCHDRESVQVAERQGFHFVDIRLTFEVKTKQIDQEALSEGFTYGLGKSEHIEELKKVGSNIYKDSRYYFDGHFDHQKINEFYRGWIEKAILGTFDDLCYCIFKGDRPIGFCTLRYTKQEAANIGLVGFSEDFQGLGLGKKLMNHVINESAAKNIKKIFVVTQGRNYTAQRLYQSAGFKTFSTELWYHKWLS